MTDNEPDATTPQDSPAEPSSEVTEETAAEATEDAAGEAPDEPAAEEATADEQPAAPKRRISWSRVVAFGVLPVIVLALAGVGGYLGWQLYSLSGASTAADESLQAAKDGAIAMLSYESDAVEQQLVAARDHLTGDFRDSYTQLTDEVVIPGAQERQISAVATVPDAASVSVDGDEAVALLFIDQTVTIGDEAPTETKSSVRATLEQVDGRWLISDFLPV